MKIEIDQTTCSCNEQFQTGDMTVITNLLPQDDRKRLLIRMDDSDDVKYRIVLQALYLRKAAGDVFSGVLVAPRIRRGQLLRDVEALQLQDRLEIQQGDCGFSDEEFSEVLTVSGKFGKSVYYHSARRFVEGTMQTQEKVLAEILQGNEQ